MFHIAGQTAGSIGLKFFGDTQGCLRLKKISIFFLQNKKNFHGQRRAFQLVIYIIKQDIVYIFRSLIASQTAGLIGLNFFVNTREVPGGCFRLKKFDFFVFKFFFTRATPGPSASCLYFSM